MNGYEFLLTTALLHARHRVADQPDPTFGLFRKRAAADDAHCHDVSPFRTYFGSLPSFLAMWPSNCPRFGRTRRAG